MLNDNFKKMKKTRNWLFLAMFCSTIALPVSSIYFCNKHDNHIQMNTSHFMPLYFSFFEKDYSKLEQYIAKNDNRFIDINLNKQTNTLTYTFPETLEDYRSDTSYAMNNRNIDYSYNYEDSESYTPYKLLYNNFITNNTNVKKVLINGVEVPKEMIIQSRNLFVNRADGFYDFIIKKTHNQKKREHVKIEFIK